MSHQLDYHQLNEYISFKLEHNIMVSKYTPNHIINLEAAKKVVQDRLRFFDGHSYPCLVDIRGTVSIEFTKEARDYLARGDGIKGVKAIAILADTLISLIIGNIFITFNKPEVPTQIFRSKEAAMEWLQKYL